MSKCHNVKLRHYEKATKFEEISHLFWQNSCFFSVATKQVGDFFANFCGLLRKAGNNNYNFFDMVKLFVDLRRMEIYAWDTFTQLRLHGLHSYFLGPGISRFCFIFYPFCGLNGKLLCMQHLLHFSFKFWTFKPVKTWENGKFLFWKCLL